MPILTYLDVWPFMLQPIIMVIDSELCFQLTKETPQPRHPMFGWALTPLTDGIDLISMKMADHKLWCFRPNLGFLFKNIFQNVSAVLEEVSIFTQKLKDTADADSHEWGSMDLRLHEQTTGPGPLFGALRSLITRVKLKNIKNRLERWV
ncbi:hypothetical protein ACJ72_05124 [Emergomyces africanus]|uniref:Uncharacterized protein n=1 Tax=Emergomyces africanus TaxID=1955775 RepID=A0A1B7NUT7_9EURO|nr:hypothetical protein ACJ72_05124 [Emergomyces africanus]